MSEIIAAQQSAVQPRPSAGIFFKCAKRMSPLLEKVKDD
jgi:hypothetical protein